MATKIWEIFLKIFSIILVILAIYILGIFVFPELTDTYGNPDLNTKIRQLKDDSFSISSPDGSLNLPF